jgi:hypothetical protein
MKSSSRVQCCRGLALLPTTIGTSTTICRICQAKTAEMLSRLDLAQWHSHGFVYPVQASRHQSATYYYKGCANRPKYQHKPPSTFLSLLSKSYAHHKISLPHGRRPVFEAERDSWLKKWQIFTHVYISFPSPT